MDIYDMTLALTPTFLKEYDIYDIFHNCSNQYVLIGPLIKTNKIEIIIKDKSHSLKLIKCAHGHTAVYISEVLEYFDNIDILFDNDLIKNLKVNKYINLENKILMSTIVKNEDKYICQWIELHKFLGVEHFIIYDNSDSNTLSIILQDYIKNNTVILINWRYPYYYLKAI